MIGGVRRCVCALPAIRFILESAAQQRAAQTSPHPSCAAVEHATHWPTRWAEWQRQTVYAAIVLSRHSPRPRPDVLRFPSSRSAYFSAPSIKLQHALPFPCPSPPHRRDNAPSFHVVPIPSHPRNTPHALSRNLSLFIPHSVPRVLLSHPPALSPPTADPSSPSRSAPAMRSDTSTDIDLSSFQSTFTLPLPKPHTIPAHQFVHSRTPFASPLQLSNVSQLWNDDQCNPSRRLDDELELFGRLSLDDSDDPWRQPQKRTPTCSSANLDDGVDRPWITENPRLSSSPISEVSYQSCPTFKPPRLLAPSRSIRGDSAKNIPKPWAFCPSWSLNATLHDPTVYTETIATFRETPSDDSVFGSDTDSSGPSINARRVSQSTSSKQPQDLLARPKGMYIQHYNPCRNVAYKKSSADFDPHHPSRASMEADIPPKNGVADTSSKILAGASQESMLINQLQSQHAWMNDQPHSTTRSFIPVSYFATHPQFDYPDQWTTTTGLDGPSPRNRKQELYKTEMCRNWEEKGTCEYASRCQFAHGQHELRPVVRDPRWKTKPCKSFVQYGYCPYAKRCCFRHDQGATEYVPSSTNTARSSLLQRVGVMPENSSERRRSTVSLSGSPSY